MTLKNFSTENKFGLLIDLRSMASQKMHGSGTRLVNTTDGIQLEIDRDLKGSGTVNCHIFVISDSQFNILNKQLESVQYWNESWQYPIQLIVGPTNSGKTQFLVNQLCGLFNGKFDFIVLICPTFAHNRTLDGFGERDPRLYIVIREHHAVEKWLKIVSFAFEGTNTLIVLDDCAASKDVKRRTG